MKKLLCVLLTSVSPLVFSSDAFAANKPSSQLPAVTVTAEKDSLVSPSVAEAKEKIDLIPGSVALVDSKEFTDSRAVTIKDMLDFTPGVLAQPRINEESRLSIRGSGLSRTYHLRGLNLYQDNIPLNLTDGGGDFPGIDPLALRYVEVYKGANALPLGAATLGGAINFVTPTGYDADKFGARIEGGSFGTLREQLSSGNVIGDTDYFASISNLRSDGYRDFSDQNNTRFFGNIGQKLNSNLETRFYFTYGDLNQELPGNLTKTQLREDPKQANGFYKSNNWQRDVDVYRVANKTTWRGDNIEINGGVYTQQQDLYHPIYVLIDQHNSDYGAFVNGTVKGTVAGKRNELTLGTNLSTGDTNAKQYVNLTGDYGALLAEGREKADTQTFYAENRFYPVNDLALIAGSQFLHSKRDYEDRFLSNGNQSGEKDYYGISPKIGALWDVAPGLQLFTNLSAAYEPPTFNEVEQQLPGAAGLANIDAQKSTTFEIGGRGTWQHVDFDASIYHSWLRDELMMYTVAPGQDAVTNANKSYHQGVELGAGAKLADNLFANTDKLKFRFAYTYSDFRFDNDATYGDNRIPGAPEHYIRTELRYDHPSGWYVAPNMEATPKGYNVDMANTLKSSGYAIFGAKAGYDITQNVTVFVDARNLADKTYAATTDVITAPGAFNTAVFTPGDGRSFFAGLTYKW
jgi:iron complex outermembrane receptor protein